MTLRSALFDVDGVLSNEMLIDDRVCDCCQTSAVITGDDGILVAYRNRSEEEIRDIAVVKYKDGSWSEPVIAHDDNWQIAGCPVNGPALASSTSHVALAWFTAARGIPRVHVAVSSDHGSSFSQPLQVDSGNPLGRVDLAVLDNTRILVSWLEGVGEEAEIRVRTIDISQPKSLAGGAPLTVAMTSPSRASGFPQMVKVRDAVVLAWTEVLDDRQSTIRSAKISDRSLLNFALSEAAVN